jgi:hypothetical protein
LSSPEVKKVIQFGSSRVAIGYPPKLKQWFEDLAAPADRSRLPDKWVRLHQGNAPDRYDVVASDADGAKELEIGEALATFWERIGFLLVNELSDAMALHAAAVRIGDGFVLIPGSSGSGKTRLSLWYLAHGFELGTDEIVGVELSPNGGPVLSGALERPLVIKSVADVGELLPPEESNCLQQASSFGTLVKLRTGGAWQSEHLSRGIMVYPTFVAGSQLQLTPLTPGESCLRLLDTCLNVRNLPRGGLSLAGALARQVPAVALRYGAREQLEGTLDVLTRQVLAARPSLDDLTALCEAFVARSAIRSGQLSVSAPEVKDAGRTPNRVAPVSTERKFARRLTVGMATYDDYDGVYFTIQALRLANPELEGAIEFVVIDNNPGGPCSQALNDLSKWVDGYRYVPRGEWSGTSIRNAIFEEASSPWVMCVDSHVLVAPGALAKLIAHVDAEPDSRDLLQGPMIYDDLRNLATHMEPRWRGGMYGIWAEDSRGSDPASPVFEIPMHGLGLFAMRKTAWPAFNAGFRGFGGEEGYIHEKVRRLGGRALCLPSLRWLHKFGRPLGTSYVNRWEDRIRNYVIGFEELGLDFTEMEAHFGELLGVETSARIFREIRSSLLTEATQ